MPHTHLLSHSQLAVFRSFPPPPPTWKPGRICWSSVSQTMLISLPLTARGCNSYGSERLPRVPPARGLRRSSASTPAIAPRSFVASACTAQSSWRTCRLGLISGFPPPRPLKVTFSTELSLVCSSHRKHANRSIFLG